MKSIVKGSKVSRLGIHVPVQPDDLNCVNSIDLSPEKSNDPFYRNLREADIDKAILLCYHYRIISEESNLRKIETSQFEKYKTDVENLNLSDHPDMIDLFMSNKLTKS